MKREAITALTTDPPPKRSHLTTLRRDAMGCTRCPLYADATQTVFGEGRRDGLMLVGEQPGDQEDKEGRPFVGPAGRLLRELLEEANLADATAAQALLGRAARVGALRGAPRELPNGLPALVTIRPSAVLRADDRKARKAELLLDLELARGTFGALVRRRRQRRPVR